MILRWMLAASCMGALIWDLALATTPLPTVDTHVTAGRYDSPLEAVSAAGRRYLERSRRSDSEYVGGVLRDTSGTYRYSVGRADAGSDQVRFRVSLFAGSELVAFWHTHGRAGPERELFSREDMQLVATQDLPLYLVTPSGRIRLLRPDAVRRLRPRESVLARNAAARGVIAGRIR